MKFKFSDFIKKNLLSGYDKGAFTAEQVNLFAFNYQLKGQLSQEDFDEVIDHVNNPKITEDETTQ